MFVKQNKKALLNIQI